MNKIQLTLMLILIGVLALSGCSEQALETAPIGESLNYEDDFGGYDISDEAPGFGEPTIQEEMTEDADLAFSEPEFVQFFDSLEQRAEVRVRRMEILWGMLEYDSTVAEVTDWSGSLEIERGAIRVARLIRFERGDRIVRPRSICGKLEWVSYTRPHFDGIMVFIYEFPDTSSPEPNTVTFKTGLYERTFEVSELDSLSEIVEVDEIGNKVSFNSFLTTPEDRDRGFLDGRWVKAGRYGRGVFFGRWMSWDGIFQGHVRGHWGINNDGDRVFFGKWISRHGSFRGLLRGTWEPDELTDAADPLKGSFEGVWADRSLTVRGQLGGRWTAIPFRPADGGDGGNGGNDGGNGDRDGNGDGYGYGDSDGRHSGDEIGRIPSNAHGFFHGRWIKNNNEE